VTKLPQWAYLEPLKKLRPLWAELQKHGNRLRKGNDEMNADGKLAANPGRIGPLTLDARRRGLATVRAIQADVNRAADSQGRPRISLINPEEEARILELIAANTWPNKWTGDELLGDTDLPQLYADGSEQQIFGW
jgi:DNA sulfur modification protein DndC